MNNDDLVQLSKTSLFADLPLSALEQLADTGFVQTEPVNAILFDQGDMPHFLHVILAGRVALVGTSASHPGLAEGNGKASRHQVHEAIIEIFHAGDVVIAPAVLLNRPYLMAARVLEPSRIAFLPAGAIRTLLHESPGFSQASALMLAEHWRLLARQLKDQKLRSGTERLGAYLLSFLSHHATGEALINLPLDRQTLASWLGMSAEHLSRSLVQMQKIGVAVTGRKVHISDIDRLRAFCLEDDLR